VKNLTTAAAYMRLGDVMSFTADEPAEAAGVPVQATEAYLRLRRVDAGSFDPKHTWPSATPLVAARPFVHHDGRYIVPTPWWLSRGLRSVLEDTVNADKPGAVNKNKALWDTYLRHRGSYLERAALDLLSAALPYAEVHRSLKYQVVEAGKTEDGELDGLVILDRALFLVESKAGGFVAQAMRGDRERLKRNLEALLGDAHTQGLRAKKHVESSRPAVFTLPDGKQLRIDRSDFDTLFVITVSLDDLSPFTPMLPEVAKSEIFGPGELPWAVSLAELAVVCDMLEFPSQLVHFLQRRAHVNELGRFRAEEELDYFGLYLDNGLRVDELGVGMDWVALPPSTERIDAYYERGDGSVRKPTRSMPDDIRRLLRNLELAHSPGYLVAASVMHDMNKLDHANAVRSLRQLRREVRESGRANGVVFYRPDRSAALHIAMVPDSRSLEVSRSILERMAVKAKQGQGVTAWAGIAVRAASDLPIVAHVAFPASRKP
jgi:hypothetical protein